MGKHNPASGRRAPPNKMTRHHLVPRCRSQQGDGVHVGNVKKVRRCVHEAWHELFGAMMPHEVVAYIVTVLAPAGYFTAVSVTARWEGATYHFDLDKPKTAKAIVAVKRRFNRLDWEMVFGTITHFSAVTQVVTQWSPPGFFIAATVKAATEETYEFALDADPSSPHI